MTTPKSSETIAFRVSPDLLRRIDACRQAGGVSRGAWVREAAQERAYDVRREEDAAKLEAVLTQLEQVLEAQRSLAEQLQAAVLLILVKTADLEPSEAKRLIRRVMTPPGA
jgi:uncharacterized protein (DUF1778 family)